MNMTTQRKLIAVRVDPNLCVGSGMCVASFPDRFAMQSDGHANYTATVLDEAAAREAEELCPVSAISLVFDEENAL
jgi:ferredoxin